MESGIMEGPMEEVSSEELTCAMKKIKLGKASGLSKVKICQKLLNGKGMLEDWKTNVMVPILD